MKYKCFIGKIQEMAEQDGEACVNFMMRGKVNTTTSNFMWPDRKDVVWVRKEDILCVTDPQCSPAQPA